jgi:hypothetical protein
MAEQRLSKLQRTILANLEMVDRDAPDWTTLTGHEQLIALLSQTSHDQLLARLEAPEGLWSLQGKWVCYPHLALRTAQECGAYRKRKSVEELLDEYKAATDPLVKEFLYLTIKLTRDCTSRRRNRWRNPGFMTDAFRVSFSRSLANLASKRLIQTETLTIERGSRRRPYQRITLIKKCSDVEPP